MLIRLLLHAASDPGTWAASLQTADPAGGHQSPQQQQQAQALLQQPLPVGTASLAPPVPQGQLPPEAVQLNIGGLLQARFICFCAFCGIVTRNSDAWCWHMLCT